MAVPPRSVEDPPKARYFPTRAAAEAWLDAAVAAARAPVPAASATTLGDWLGAWLAARIASGVWAIATQAKYAEVAGYWRPAAATPLTDLTTSQLQTIVAGLVTTGAPHAPTNRLGHVRPPPRPLGRAALDVAVTVLRQALEAARDDGLISRNPAARLALPRAEPSEPKLWTTAEVDKLHAAALGHPLEALVTLLLSCGLRIGELLGLRWEAVDLAAARLQVARIVDAKGRVQEWPKSRRRRWVTLPPSTVAALVRHRARSPSPSGWVFEREGRPWVYGTVRKQLRRLCADAGVRPLGSHAGRHTHSSRLLDAGVPPSAVAARLGHADPSTTLSHYSHSSREGEQAALEAAEGVFGTSPYTVGGGGDAEDTHGAD